MRTTTIQYSNCFQPCWAPSVHEVARSYTLDMAIFCYIDILTKQPNDNGCLAYRIEKLLFSATKLNLNTFGCSVELTEFSMELPFPVFGSVKLFRVRLFLKFRLCTSQMLQTTSNMAGQCCRAIRVFGTRRDSKRGRLSSFLYAYR